MLFSNKREATSQNVKNKVIKLNDIYLNIRIDRLTYWIIDALVTEKTVNDNKINLQTNPFIKALIDKAMNEFILNNQCLMTEKLNRELSILDDKLDEKEIKFEDIFQIYDLILKQKKEVNNL